MSDSLNQLADILYGRAAMPNDYIGGSDARIFHDAAVKVATLEASCATVAAALTEALAAIAAIEQNPLATTDRQHVEFTKRDAADIVRAAMAKLGVTENQKVGEDDN
jgi:hypothetical protein